METLGRKSRASSPQHAREYRQRGHDVALLFAKSLGMTQDYQNNPKAKKDVIDPSGDAHSVKSGATHWQMFLYSKTRFETDVHFRVMNGIGQILLDCINSFPDARAEYNADKARFKKQLGFNMVRLADVLQDRYRLQAFLSKSISDGGEVKYLTFYHENRFHVFSVDEVARRMAAAVVVTNSKARPGRSGETDDQKVLLKYEGTNLGEVEIRNDSNAHYREIKFNWQRKRAIKFLFDNIYKQEHFNENIIAYGEAIKHFGRWPRA